MSIEKENIRKDWYQTESDVVISLLIKGLKKEDVEIKLEPVKLIFNSKSQSRESTELVINLAHSINPQKSSWKVLSSKVEIKLKKEDDIRWSSLESSSPVKTQVKAEVDPVVPKYPSSAPESKNWDKIAFDLKKEEENEKLEGDAALNQLFQKIYKDGNDEIRRAMNKSFTESGGTVLSTNWSEVGEKSVQVKPPDGMEYKKWDI